jgi:hypothetical protein
MPIALQYLYKPCEKHSTGVLAKKRITPFNGKRLEQDDATYGKNSAGYQQQNQGEFDNLPAKAQVALVSGQKINSEGYRD